MGQHAVVVGGGMGGMCAAAMLSRRFERVTLLERDGWPQTAEIRSGTPQARHPHSLLARGRRELDRLFPGFSERLTAGGAVPLDEADIARFFTWGWLQMPRTGVQELYASRALLEATVRELFAQRSNIRVLDRTAVSGLVADPANPRRIIGVGVAGDPSGVIEGDLVVDASGRFSKSPKWLRSLGLEPPQEEVVDSRMTYTTQWFQAPKASEWPDPWWWKASWIMPSPPDILEGAVLFPVEGGRWIVTLGRFSDQPGPRSNEEFLAALKRIRSPLIFEAVRLATPISQIYGYRATAHRWRRYDTWDVDLAGFVAISDSLVAFNPVGGRGITFAALQASELGRQLSDVPDPGDPRLPRRFYQSVRQLVHRAWSEGTGYDLKFPQTESNVSTTHARPKRLDWLRHSLAETYLGLLNEAAAHDATVARRLTEVFQYLRDPSEAFEPSTVMRVLAVKARRVAATKTWSRENPDGPMPPVAGRNYAAF